MNSGLYRAGLPETEAPRRSAALKVGTRPTAASARTRGRADLDRENGVVAWLDTPSPPTRQLRAPQTLCGDAGMAGLTGLPNRVA